MNRLLKAAAMTALLMLIAQGIMMAMLIGAGHLTKQLSRDHDTQTVLIGAATGSSVMAAMIGFSLLRKKDLTGLLMWWTVAMTFQSLIGMVITLATLDQILGTRWAPHVPQPYNLIGLAVELMMFIILVKLELKTRFVPWAVPA